MGSLKRMMGNRPLPAPPPSKLFIIYYYKIYSLILFYVINLTVEE